jgi:hypothetical protein
MIGDDASLFTTAIGDPNIRLDRDDRSGADIMRHVYDSEKSPKLPTTASRSGPK